MTEMTQAEKSSSANLSPGSEKDSGINVRRVRLPAVETLQEAAPHETPLRPYLPLRAVSHVTGLYGIPFGSGT